MIFYRKPDGSWHGTQADAGKDRIQVDVPVSKPELLVWLNEHVGAGSFTREPECDDLVAPDLTLEVNTPLGQASSLPTGNDVEETILAAEPPEFARYLQCVFERLGELRSNGWHGLKKLISDNPQSRTSLERGLGYLILEATNERSN